MTTEIDRRAFLKKAGLATGAAAALYVVPTITTVGARPAYAAVTGVVGQCYAVSIIDCSFDNEQTTVVFKVCNNCGQDVSHVAFEEFPGENLATAPAEGSWTGPQIGGQWTVSHTSGAGQPPYPAIKFDADNDHGFKDGACEVFTVTYYGDLKDRQVAIRVTGKHGSTVQDILTIPV